MWGGSFLLTGYSTSIPKVADAIRFASILPYEINGVVGIVEATAPDNTKKTNTTLIVAQLGSVDPAVSANADEPPIPIDSSHVPTIVLHGTNIQYTASTYGDRFQLYTALRDSPVT